MIWGEPDATSAILKERGAVAPPMPLARVRLVCAGMRPFESAYPRVRLVGVGLAASQRPPVAPTAPTTTVVVPFKRVRVIGVGGGEDKVKVHKLPKRLQGAATTAATMPAMTAAKALSAAVARVAASDCQTRAWLQTAQAVVNDDRPAREVLREMLNRRTREREDAQLREDIASFGLPPLVPEFELGWLEGLL